MDTKKSHYTIVSFIFLLVFFFLILGTTFAGAASVTLSWDPSNPVPQGYRLFSRKVDQAYNYSLPAWEGKATTCTISNLDDQTEYCFIVRAYNGNNESSNSNEICLAPPVANNPGSDATPPVWNGATTGIGLAADSETGGSVTVEFDTAIDLIDRTNLRFNVYYAASKTWKNINWDSNHCMADADVGRGSIFANAVTISGLTNGLSYTFGVRVEDRSGNEDTNTITSTATPTQYQLGNVFNLASNQPAVASSVEQSGLEAFRVVDGSSATRWSSLFSNNQWIYVDLGTVQAIDRVVLDWETAYGARYEIQVSNNTANWTTVYTETNGDGDIDDIRFPSTAARYVRMRGIQRATPWGYSLFDFKVYAASESSPVVGSTPIALGRPAFASSTERSGLEATRAVDGSPTTRWSSTHSDHQWIYVDLGTVHTIDRVVLDWETAYGARYEIQVSDDAVVWNTVYTEFNGDGDLDDIPLPSTAARYVRMKGIQRATPWGYSLFELEVYGSR